MEQTVYDPLSARCLFDFLSCNGGVCDQTVDYGRGSQMSGIFLATDIHSSTDHEPGECRSMELAGYCWRHAGYKFQ